MERIHPRKRLKKGPTTRLIALAVMATSLVHCGSDEDKKGLSISLTPQEPYVRNGDITVKEADGEGNFKFVTISAPWIKFNNITFKNESDKTITVETMNVKIISDSGSFSESTIDPGSLYDLGQDPSAIDVCLSDSVLAVMPTNTDCPLANVFYFDGLLKDGGFGQSKYTIEITAVGWFGTALEEGDRIIVTKRLRTR